MHSSYTFSLKNNHVNQTFRAGEIEACTRHCQNFFTNCYKDETGAEFDPVNFFSTDETKLLPMLNYELNIKRHLGVGVLDLEKSSIAELDDVVAQAAHSLLLVYL